MQRRHQARLSLLDGLRGVAAIAVMLYHTEISFEMLGPFRRSYLFVDFFFLLSGFVLALAYEAKFRDGMGLAFMRARIVRLWPLTAIGVVLGAACQVVPSNEAGLALLVVMGLLMLPQLDGSGQLFPLNGPQWSILMELFANFLHALLLHRLSDRALLAFVAVTAAALGLTILHFGSNTLGPFSFNWWYALPRVAFSYATGVWLARKWLLHPKQPLVTWQTAFVLPPLCVVLLAALPLDVAIGDVLTGVAILPLLLWLAVTADVPLHARPWLDRLGALSFPLYAVHLPIIVFVSGKGRSPGFWLLAVVGSLLAAQVLVWAGSRRRNSVRGVVTQPAARLT